VPPIINNFETPAIDVLSSFFFFCCKASYFLQFEIYSNLICTWNLAFCGPKNVLQRLQNIKCFWKKNPINFRVQIHQELGPPVFFFSNDISFWTKRHTFGPNKTTLEPKINLSQNCKILCEYIYKRNTTNLVLLHKNLDVDN
jgi:hypothetical protein